MLRGCRVAVFGPRRNLGASTIARAVAGACAALDPRGGVALVALAPRRPGVWQPAGPSERPTVAAPLASLAGGVASARMVADGLWQVGWSRAPRPPRASASAMAPPSPLPDASAVDALIADLGGRVRHLVLDCEHLVNERTSRALDAADRILLVTRAEVGSVRASQRVLGVCQRLGYPDDKLRVVLTRHRPDDVLSLVDVATALRREIFWTLPDDPMLASDDGRTEVPSGAFTTACAAMARALRDELPA